MIDTRYALRENVKSSYDDEQDEIIDTQFNAEFVEPVTWCGMSNKIDSKKWASELIHKN